MNIKTIILILACVVSFQRVTAQVISFKDTIESYNAHRLKVNRTGMRVLGAWGIANVAAGGVGYLTAQQDEWKNFHAMNALWGAVNTGIAAWGLSGVRKEMKVKMNAGQAYGHYKSDKKLYLINAGADVLYVATGVVLTSLAPNAKKQSGKDMLTGFGRSIALQGVALLVFDNVMFATHMRSNSKWYRIMNEIQFTGNSVGLVHSF